jgi:hypothetical protein
MFSKIALQGEYTYFHGYVYKQVHR